MLGGAILLGLAAAWFTMRGDQGAAYTSGAPVASAKLPEPASGVGASPFQTTGKQWQAKAVAPVASASAIAVGPLYGRNGRELDFGGLSAAQYIDHYAPAARRGDARAAYAVYQAESVCATANEAVPQFELPEQRAQYVQQRDALALLCAGVSPAQIQERMGFLSLAARSGVPDAQVDFYIEGPYGRTLDTINTDDTIVKGWQQESQQYLKNAASQCDPYAMGLMANAWDAGDFGGRDASQAAAFAVAEASTRKRPLTLQQLTQRFGEDLSPEQLEASMRTGQDMARDACKSQ